MNQNGSLAESLAKLNELIKDIKVAMLTTEAPDGMLRSRPMATQEAEFQGDLWFFTRSGSPKTDEIRDHSQVNVAYANPDGNSFVSMSGTALIVRDRAKMKELWNPALKAWFPDGLDDPNLTLLRVEVEQAQYWDAASNKMALLPGFVKSLATGEEFTPGENKIVDLEDEEVITLHSK